MTMVEDVLEALAPYLAADNDPDGDLADLATTIGEMWAQVDELAGDDPDGEGSDGYSALMDPDTCPAYALPWLAQWAGERLPVGLSADEARQWIKDGPNQRRGTPVSIARAAQRRLTGSRTVQIVERTFPDGSDDPDGDHFNVYTYTDETPDADRVWLELLTTIPADMVCNYEVITGPTWASFMADYATWADFEAAFPTWRDAMEARPGASVWTR